MCPEPDQSPNLSASLAISSDTISYIRRHILAAIKQAGAARSGRRALHSFTAPAHLNWSIRDNRSQSGTRVTQAQSTTW